MGQIVRVSLHGPFEMDGGKPSPVVLKATAGWKLRIDNEFLVAELGNEIHFIPVENIAGIRPEAPANPVQAPTSDPGAITQRDMKPANAGRRRAGAGNTR